MIKIFVKNAEGQEGVEKPLRYIERIERPGKPDVLFDKETERTELMWMNDHIGEKYEFYYEGELIDTLTIRSVDRVNGIATLRGDKVVEEPAIDED